MPKSKKNLLGNINLGRFKQHLNKSTEEQLTFTRSWIDPEDPEITITFTRKPKAKHIKTKGVAYKVPRKDIRIRPIHDELYYIEKKQRELEESLKVKIIVPRYSKKTIERIMDVLNLNIDEVESLLMLYTYTNLIPGYIKGLQKLKPTKFIIVEHKNSKLKSHTHVRFARQDMPAYKSRTIPKIGKPTERQYLIKVTNHSGYYALPYKKSKEN
jgi:hypothetical protein